MLQYPRVFARSAAHDIDQKVYIFQAARRPRVVGRLVGGTRLDGPVQCGHERPQFAVVLARQRVRRTSRHPKDAHRVQCHSQASGNDNGPCLFGAVLCQGRVAAVPNYDSPLQVGQCDPDGPGHGRPPDVDSAPWAADSHAPADVAVLQSAVPQRPVAPALLFARRVCQQAAAHRRL